MRQRPSNIVAPVRVLWRCYQRPPIISRTRTPTNRRPRTETRRLVKSFPPAKIRNVALVGHGGSGKTSLAEALLYCSGTVNRIGRVEDGTTTTDFDPEEVKRGISLSMALAPFEHDGPKINPIDTPGSPDSVSDV